MLYAITRLSRDPEPINCERLSLQFTLTCGGPIAISSPPERLYQSLRIPAYQSFMGRRAISRNTVLMSGAIKFAASSINCLVRNMTISGAALDVTNPHSIPEHFNLIFKADGTHIPCHVIWREEERIGVAFD